VLCVPGFALAADPPTILAAGINGADQLYATWSLGAGTIFSHADFSTIPDPEPEVPEFFADGNLAAYDCVAPAEGCTATPTSTSFTADAPSPRDRRYFVKVTAVAAGPPDALTSAIWVIDDAKSVIPGEVPRGAGPPTNSPVSGHPLEIATAPGAPGGPGGPGPGPGPGPGTPGALPQPLGAAGISSITVLSVPKSIRGVVRSGVKLQVTCAGAACTVAGSLLLNGKALARKRGSIPAGVTRTLVLKPVGMSRDRLRKRSRARLRISGMVTPASGAPQRVVRLFTVRR
jgi:hypothetical protein